MSDFGDQLRTLATSIDVTLAGLQNSLDNVTAERDAALAALAECQSPWELVHDDTFDLGIDTAYWFINNGSKFAADRVVATPGSVRLEVRAGADNVWRGALIGMKTYQTYGKFEVDCYLEAGAFRGVADLWSDLIGWPENGETDFHEIGANDPQRLKSTQSLHFPDGTPNGGIVPTNYTASSPFTNPHTVGVEWTPGQLVYTCDGEAKVTVTDDRVPSWPMKLHLQSYISKTIPPTFGAFVITGVRVYEWKPGSTS